MRPRKYNKVRYLTICLDDKDVSFLDDHRGKLTRGDYLIESMYALKGETSNHLKELTENYKKTSMELYELKRQAMFKGQKIKARLEIDLSNELNLIQFFDTKLKANIQNLGLGNINYKSVFERNQELLIDYFETQREFQVWVVNHYKNNGNSLLLEQNKELKIGGEMTIKEDERGD